MDLLELWSYNFFRLFFLKGHIIYSLRAYLEVSIPDTRFGLELFVGRLGASKVDLKALVRCFALLCFVFPQIEC
jgi:hypothetical protein